MLEVHTWRKLVKDKLPVSRQGKATREIEVSFVRLWVTNGYHGMQDIFGEYGYLRIHIYSQTKELNAISKTHTYFVLALGWEVLEIIQNTHFSNVSSWNHSMTQPYPKVSCMSFASYSDSKECFCCVNRARPLSISENMITFVCTYIISDEWYMACYKAKVTCILQNKWHPMVQIDVSYGSPYTESKCR